MPAWTHSIGALVVCAAGLLTPSTGAAQDAVEDPTTAAETSEPSDAPDPEARLRQAEQDGDARLHYELAVRALRRGEFVEAGEHFDTAHELSGRPEMLYNSYLAWRDGGDRARALGSLRGYLAGDWEIVDRARLEAILVNMEAEAAASAEAAESSSTEPPPAARPAPVQPPESAGPPVGGIVLLSLGGATLITSAITGGLAIAAASDVEAACPADRCPASEADNIDGLRTLSLVTDILWPVGAALAVGGLIWLVVELGADEPTVALGPGRVELRGSF